MRALLAFTLISLASFAAHARIAFPPVDESAKDSTFVSYKNELLKIVAKKDLKALLKHTDDNIDFSFGDDAGKDGFIRFWGLEGKDAEKSLLWQELETVLKLGGTYDPEQNMFIAPYVFSMWPNVEPYENQAILAKNVRVRAQPSTHSPTLYVASYEILSAEYSDGAWVPVTTPDGKKGYVSSAFIRSPIDYRAFFEKKNGTWLMKIFIAGD